ncbi:MAG TPA: response regulator transcription factor [Pyrinomonadaceae bacterium]|nr:response regulator transcription factor [Pyrinomonadaceae bacterium]
MRTRVILLDDHRILLDALRSLIEREYDVVATFQDCQTLLNEAENWRPDVIVMDIAMPVMNGLTAAKRLKAMLPKTKLVFLTADEDLETAAEAFRLGASGYVIKSSASVELITALREVVRGGYYASPVLTEGMVGSFVRAFKMMKSPHGLTTRQREVLKLLAEGMSMKQVALALDITPRTVAYHKYTMMDQLNIGSNAELMGFALSHLN